jgi:hypothetical protein
MAPPAKSKPGSPAPTIGAGTPVAATVAENDTFVRLGPWVVKTNVPAVGSKPVKNAKPAALIANVPCPAPTGLV